MQRLIRSFNTLTDDLREKLQEQYPDGIDNTHIRTIATAKGESLRVIELRTSDAIYLIKINAESREEIDQFLDQDDGAAATPDDLDATDGEDIAAPDGAEDAAEEEDDIDKDLDADGEDADADADAVSADEDEDED